MDHPVGQGRRLRNVTIVVVSRSATSRIAPQADPVGTGVAHPSIGVCEQPRTWSQASAVQALLSSQFKSLAVFTTTSRASSQLSSVQKTPSSVRVGAVPA